MGIWGGGGFDGRWGLRTVGDICLLVIDFGKL